MTDAPKVEPGPRVVAALLGLGAFAVAIVAGLASGSESAGLLMRAVMSAAACYLVGAALGAAGERTMREHAERHRESNPVPEPPSENTMRAAQMAARAAASEGRS